ncbi:hypothetical protein ACT3R7_03970 [Halomonas sp. AOP43-A1-21]|uniref:hypothetical protein n=2 Tax=Halomonadaceae TaxID=28256 RepID=UPI0018673411|nr:hypothetical protein [Halomonas colorata]
MTISTTPFSVNEFRQELSVSNQRKMLTWAGCELRVAFWRTVSGKERPAVIKINAQRYYVASTSADNMQTWFARIQREKNLQESPGDETSGDSSGDSSGEGYEKSSKKSSEESFEESSELVIKSLSLAELARNAHIHQLGIHLSDEQAAMYFSGSIMTLWGETAILEDKKGQEIIYRAAEVFTFESPDEPDPIPYGAVQYWHDGELEYNPDRDLSKQQSLHVFDDQWDWNSPLFPTLPDKVQALSSLSSNAQAFFERMRVPPLQSPEPEPVQPPAPEPSYQNAFVGADNLASFHSLRGMVDQDIVPPADDITLTITKDAKHRDKRTDSTERWGIRISFTTPMGFNAVFDPDWLDASLCKANTTLPDTTGVHHASDVLRERIVNHLAWSFFQHGRGFVKTLFGTALKGLLPNCITNGYGAFQLDYADKRFPCLARFQCGELEVAVLLLGQDKGNYVCMPLKFEEIPEADLPTLVPRRSELISMESKSIILSEHHHRLIIPMSLIDFPDHWYRGIRVSNQHIKSQFIFGMRFNTMIAEMENEQTTTARFPLKWIIAGCAAVVLGVILGVSL